MLEFLQLSLDGPINLVGRWTDAPSGITAGPYYLAGNSMADVLIHVFQKHYTSWARLYTPLHQNANKDSFEKSVGPILVS